MKKIMGLLAVLAMVGCSSSDKNMEETATEATTEVQTQAQTHVDHAEQAATTTVDTATTKVVETTTSVDFPPITGTEKSASTCTSGNESRKISVLDTGNGCGVVYNKFSADKTVAMAKYDMAYCDKVAENITSNLTGAGFSCDNAAAAATPAESSSTDQ